MSVKRLFIRLSSRCDPAASSEEPDPICGAIRIFIFYDDAIVNGIDATARDRELMSCVEFDIRGSFKQC